MKKAILATLISQVLRKMLFRRLSGTGSVHRSRRPAPNPCGHRLRRPSICVTTRCVSLRPDQSSSKSLRLPGNLSGENHLKSCNPRRPAAHFKLGRKVLRRPNRQETKTVNSLSWAKRRWSRSVSCIFSSTTHRPRTAVQRSKERGGHRSRINLGPSRTTNFLILLVILPMDRRKATSVRWKRSGSRRCARRRRWQVSTPSAPTSTRCSHRPRPSTYPIKFYNYRSNTRNLKSASTSKGSMSERRSAQSRKRNSSCRHSCRKTRNWRRMYSGLRTESVRWVWMSTRLRSRQAAI